MACWNLNCWPRQSSPSLQLLALTSGSHRAAWSLLEATWQVNMMFHFFLLVLLPCGQVSANRQPPHSARLRQNGCCGSFSLPTPGNSQVGSPPTRLRHRPVSSTAVGPICRVHGIHTSQWLITRSSNSSRAAYPGTKYPMFPDSLTDCPHRDWRGRRREQVQQGWGKLLAAKGPDWTECGCGLAP